MQFVTISCFNINVLLQNNKLKSLTAIGKVDVGSDNPNIDLDVNFEEFLLDPLNPFGQGVITNIRLTHKSIGMTNEQWETNKNTFATKYSDFLPLKVKFTDPKDLKPYEVDISRLIRVFVNNITAHRRSVK